MINARVTMSDSLRELLSSCACECRVAKWLMSDYHCIHNRLAQIGDYWTFREKQGLITYMPKGRKQEFNNQGDWLRAGREGIKPGKLIRRLFQNVRFVKDQDIEVFVNKFQC